MTNVKIWFLKSRSSSLDREFCSENDTWENELKIDKQFTLMETPTLSDI